MSLTIYTAGDATFLEEVLLAVAAVAGSGSIASVAAVGALVTVLILGFRAIMEGGRAIRFEELLLGFIIYMIAFYPTTTALIEDGYTGNVHVVDNVPFGPVAAGWVASSVGYKLTKIFETGYRFTSHGSSDSLHRFAEPLEILMMLRSSSENPVLMSSVNANLGTYADTRRSWENYFKECTLIKVDLGITSADKLVHQDFLEEIRFNSSVYGTRLFLGEHGGSDYTCKDAYTALRSAMRQGMLPNSSYDKILHGMLTRGMDNNELWGGESSAHGKLEAAAAQMVGLGTDVQKYMETTILQPVFEDAIEGKYTDMLDAAAAIAFRQSLTQRNTQWAQEQSAFMTVIRPAMTFFEGFVYAITPMLAMLFVMGKFGFSLAGKYLQTIFWVQLWLPILSICNLYVRNAADKQLKAIAPTAESQEVLFSSIYGVNNVPAIMESWLGVGSMLAAATPMLAFFLISGSSFAFTNIAGRLGGQDHFDEKTVTPDATKIGASTNVAGGISGTRAGGSLASGSEPTVPKISVSSVYSNAVASSQTDYQDAQAGFENTFQNTLQSSTSEGKQYQTIKSLQDSGAFSSGKTSGYSESDVDGISDAHKVSASTVKRHIAHAATAIKGGVGFKTPGGLLSLGATHERGMKEEAGVEDNSSYAKDITAAAQSALQRGMGASIMDQLSDTFTESGANTHMAGITSSQADALNEKASKVSGTREQYAKTSTNTEALQNTREWKYNEIGTMMHNAGQGPALAGIIGSDREMQTEAAQNTAMYSSDAYGMGENTARAAGMFAAIMDKGTPAQKLDAVNAFAAVAKGSDAPAPTASFGDAGGGAMGGPISTAKPTGVDADSITPKSVGSVVDKSATVPGTAIPQAAKDNYEGLYTTQDTSHKNEKDQNFAMSNAQQNLDSTYTSSPEVKDYMTSFGPEKYADSLMKDGAAHAMASAALTASVLKGAYEGKQVNPGTFTDLKREAYMAGNAGTGAQKDFDTRIAPNLTSGQAAYFAETRMNGGLSGYKEAAYSNMRDEFATPQEDGSIARDSAGHAILSESDEDALGKITAIIDRNQHTVTPRAAYETKAIGQYNTARFNTVSNRK